MKNFPGFLILLLSAIIATSAIAADVISVIQYPLTARPALVKSGGEFYIVCKAGESTTGWSARIFTDYNTIQLGITYSYSKSTGQWTLKALVPANTPFELYNLKVTAAGLDDEVIHAVKVLQNFQDTYYFIHLPDLHLPAVSWVGYYDDVNTVSEFKKIIKEIAIINPEFVLQTGDLVDNGSEASQYKLAQELVNELTAPVFITGGNHDLWHDGHKNWKKYINPVMDYSFNYGQHHFAGLEMYDNPTVTFTAAQMQWLQSDLRKSLQENQPLRTLFYHYDESHQIDDDFVDDYQVNLLLYGHTHINGVNSVGSSTALNINTSFTMNNRGEYRIVKVSNNQIESYPVIAFNNIHVNYSPANDGTNWKVKATIKNDTSVPFENGRIKFLVLHNASGYTVTGGTVLQTITTSAVDVYYVQVNIQPNSVQDVLIQSNSPLANSAPQINTFSPKNDTLLIAGFPTTFKISATDPNNNALQYTWFLDGVQITGASTAQYIYTPNKQFKGLAELKARVRDGEYYDEHTWMVEVSEYTNKPKVISSVVNFFLRNEIMEIKWLEPTPMDSRFEYGIKPGHYTGIITENGANMVSFVPEAQGMGLGVHYCRITDGSIYSDPFTVIIESPNAPQMLSPLGNITNLAPIFTWDKVPGVPYYMVICSDQEIIIKEDPETREFSVEGANPIWSVLTSDNSVPYGIPDPSGTFTSAPSPLIPGEDYWWVVLNCYGNAPEMTSPVQSGISKFTVNLPPPNISAPVLKSPANNVALKGDILTFSWEPVQNAKAYHFYPFKIENESGIETARGIWENIIATTQTSLDFNAGQQMMKGRYRWKVSAVAANGMEVMSQPRDFNFDAPSAVITIRTYDSRNTLTNTGDDIALPRVHIKYNAISGIHNSLPLSTDLRGERLDFVISPGVYQFIVEKENYDTIIDTLTFVKDQTATIIFRLNPGKCSIIGSVVDNSAQPVYGADITVVHALHADITKKITTDTQGNFMFSVVPGPYHLIARKTGFRDSDTMSVSINSGEDLNLSEDIILVKNANYISGFVVNEQQQPVFGARVTLTNTSVLENTTDANGRFEMTAQDGIWKIGATKQGFVSPALREISVSNGTQLQISPSLLLKANAGIVSGMVSNGSVQISEAVIKAWPVSGSPVVTKSDVYGQYNINVTPGTYTITAEKAGYSLKNSLQLTLAASETKANVNLDMIPVLCLVKGKVTVDGYTPLGDVFISNSGMTTKTTEGGLYELGVNSGEHVIFASREGYTSTPPETVTVVNGQTLSDINFILLPNASVIKGNISSSMGSVYNARVEASNSQNLTVTTSNEEGNYVLNLQAGEWDIKVVKEGFVTALKENIPAGVGQTIANVDFQLLTNISTIVGVVKNQTTGLPLKNTDIKIENTELATQTSIDGAFSFSVEPGSYQVKAFKANYRAVTQSTGQLLVNQAKSLVFNMEELSSSFTGKLVDKNNAPLADVEVLAVSSADTFSVLSLIDGSFTLAVKVGSYTVSAFKDGYKKSQYTGLQSITNNEVINLPVAVLQPDRGTITGFVHRLINDNPIPLAKVTAKNTKGFTAQTETDDTGHFSFVNENGEPMLHPGLYNVYITRTGFSSDTLENIVVASEQNVEVEAVLQKQDAFIKGVITAGGKLVMDVSVTAIYQVSKQVFTSISKEDGTFEVKNLPAGNYELYAVKTGYSSPAAQVVLTGASCEIALIPNSGRLLGYVKDAETLLPVSDVQITADDGHGHNGSGKTGAAGSYDITSMPQSYPYQVVYKKSGYSARTLSSVVMTDSTVQNVTLDKIYGNLVGVVRDESGKPVSGAVLRAKSTALTRTDTTGIDGSFVITRLPGDQYSLTALKAGYACDPGEQIISLWQGGDVTGIEFIMKEAIAAKLEIVGPDNINNKGSQIFSYSAKTSDQREAGIDAYWELDYMVAAEKLEQTGLFDPVNDFVGAVQLTLTDKFTGMKATRSVAITQDVNVGNNQMVVSNKRGLTLAIADSCVNQNIVLQMRRPTLPASMKSSKTFQVTGDVFQFTPAGFDFKKPVKMTIPVPEGKSASGLTIGVWNTRWLEWESIEGVQTGENSLSVNINSLGRYAILEKAEPLSIKEIKFKPNPFSPRVAPLEIIYQVSSDISDNVLVTIKIYNMTGDLVKTLVDNEYRQRGENTDHWDGITDFGKMALNGRYAIHFKVKDRSGEKEELKSFVLIK